MRMVGAGVLRAERGLQRRGHWLSGPMRLPMGDMGVGQEWGWDWQGALLIPGDRPQEPGFRCVSHSPLWTRLCPVCKSKKGSF